MNCEIFQIKVSNKHLMRCEMSGVANCVDCVNIPKITFSNSRSCMESIFHFQYLRAVDHLFEAKTKCVTALR